MKLEPKKRSFSFLYAPTGLSLGRALFLLAVPGMLAGGCASFHPKPLVPDQTAASFEARSLADPGLKKYMETSLGHPVRSWPPASWNLSELTLAALYFHPDLGVARARVDVAKAGVLAAGGVPNPTLTLSPSYATNAALSGLSPWILGALLDIPFETGGKRGARVGEAKYLFQAARLHLASAEWKVRSGVRSSLLGLYAADETESLLGKEAADLGEITALLKKGGFSGHLSLSLLQARTLLEKTELSLAQARQKKAEARVDLARALGLPVSALGKATLAFDFPDPPPAAVGVGQAKALALVNRPDILEALEKYEASQDALRLEVAKQVPNFSLGPGFTWNQGQDQWSLGFSLPLPLFNQNQGPIAVAEARRKESAARFKALQDSVVADIDRALAGYQGALAKLKPAAELLALQEKKLAWVEGMGAGSYLQRSALLRARQDRLEAEKTKLDAFVECQAALGLLEDALQRPLASAGNPLPHPMGRGREGSK